jgi:anti-anti-sigma factor
MVDTALLALRGCASVTGCGQPVSCALLRYGVSFTRSRAAATSSGEILGLNVSLSACLGPEHSRYCFRLGLCFGLSAPPTAASAGRQGNAMFPEQPVPGTDHPTPLLHIDVHRDKPEEAVIRLRGELDRVTAPALASCLSELLRCEPRCATLVVDLAETTFLDVGGLNLLLDAHDAATAGGITLCLAGCSRQVLRILRVTETVEVFQSVSNQRRRGGDGGPGMGRTAHTDLPSSNSVTPHLIDRAATTCNPRPRRARRSSGRGRGGGQR